MNDVVQESSDHNNKKDEDVPLPGFRFHPTDEELLGFYLRRKVDKKPLRIELIKQIDIYKFDPWDLPKPSIVGESESYFFCKRGRKYKNSIRPNRVTGSGFWKATGIDKPVYSSTGGHACTGLKKTLVYYRGSAGKGTKTDWMMHEFRLPTNDMINTNTNASYPKSTAPPEAEVWTICRIFKRNISHRKYTADWRELAVKRPSTGTSVSQTCSVESDSHENYITFGTSSTVENYYQKPIDLNHVNGRSLWHHPEQWSNIAQPSSVAASSSSFSNCPENNYDFFAHANWDEIKSVVESALDPFLM